MKDEALEYREPRERNSMRYRGADWMTFPQSMARSRPIERQAKGGPPAVVQLTLA